MSETIDRRLASIERVLATHDQSDHLQSEALRTRLEELRAERDQLLAEQSRGEH